MRLSLTIVLVAAGCTGDGGTHGDGTGEMLDRSDLDLNACATDLGSFAGLTPDDPVDYFELRHDWGSESVGERCGGAADAAACEAAFAALTAPPDAWAMGTGGGIPAPLFYILYTRGDEVGVVGRSDLEAFLLPTDDVYDAAFLAQVATLGSVDCSAASARAVPGGHEVVTRRSETCGGGVIDFRVFVGEDGVTTIVEQVQVTPAEDVICP